jgi:hypothetical protein
MLGKRSYGFPGDAGTRGCPIDPRFQGSWLCEAIFAQAALQPLSSP